MRKYCNVSSFKSLFIKKIGDRGRERYRRAGITASTSFISKALNIVISFVSVPLTIHYLGSERYGVWLVISSLLTWMAMTDFGLAGNALVNVLAESDGKDDRNAAREYAASAFWALSAIGLVLGIVFLAAFPWIPWRTVFNVSATVPAHELQQACALTLIFFVAGMPLSILNSVYSAYQDGFVMNLWGIASNTLALAGLIIVTQFRGGLPYLVIALSGTRALVHFANGFYLFFRRYPWLIPAPTAVRWMRIKRLLKLGGKYLVTQLASLGIYQSQPMIITQLLRAIAGGHLRCGAEDHHFAERSGLYGHRAVHLRLQRSQGPAGLDLDQRRLPELDARSAGLRRPADAGHCGRR